MRRPRPRARAGRSAVGGREAGPLERSAAPRTEPTPKGAPAELLAQLERALSAGSLEEVAVLRAEIAARAPNSTAGAEAAFKLGLQKLFGAELEGAAASFRDAIRARQAPWSRQARIALAQVLFRTGRPQQATFELRKAIDEGEGDLAGAQARALLVDVLRSTGRAKEAERLRDLQKTVLERLGGSKGPEGAIALVWLGYERKHDGERRAAREALEAALRHPSLPEAERRAAEAALASL